MDLLIILVIFFIFLLFNSRDIEQRVHQSLKNRPTTTDNTDVPIRPIRGNRLMTTAERNAYLLSPQWKALRKLVIERDKCCQLTGDVTYLEVHHIHYDNLGNEYLDDLVLLSRRAHQFVHDYYGSYDRYNTYPITEELRAAYALNLLNNP